MKFTRIIPLALFWCLSFNHVWAEDQQAAECANVEDEIAQLKEQKQSTGGLFSITPVGMLAKAGQSDEKKQKRKEVKEQNNAIDAQIDALKEKCGI